MPNRSATSPENENGQTQAGKVEAYLIAPRTAGDESQLRELQRCRQAIEQLSPEAVSGGRNILKARLTQDLAQQMQRQFGASLLIERDAPLQDPRLTPDIKP